MNEKLISVIVPVYNAEKYFKDCLESILNQTYSNLELIVIDDGSDDHSAEIARVYKYDTRVHVYTQENQGVASARKNAVEYANGDYVVFFDADDYIDQDYLEQLIEVAEDFDLVTAGLFREDGKTTQMFDKLKSGDYRSAQEMCFIIDHMIVYDFDIGLTPYLCDKLFRTKLIKEVMQDINTKVFIGEDSEVLYRYILKCNTVRITHICGYHYCNREGSTTNRRHENYLTNLNEVYSSLKKVFECHPRKESLMAQLQTWTLLGIENAPRVMELTRAARFLRSFVFPFYEKMKGKKIVLYGAGNVGKDYYRQLQYHKDINVVGWIDKEAQKYQEQGYLVETPDCLERLDYDFIVISVNSKDKASQIKEELVRKRVPEKKITWKAPVCF